MSVPDLLTERLRLRQIREADAEALYPVLSDVDLMTYWSSAPHTDAAETRAYVAQNAADTPDIQCWAITEKAGDDTALGWVILMTERDHVLEFGFILDRAHWGKGYAAEAARAAITQGFSNPAILRIYADVDPDNTASLRTLGHLGFIREGRLRDEWITHIGVRDTIILGLLRDEWDVPVD